MFFYCFSLIKRKGFLFFPSSRNDINGPFLGEKRKTNPTFGTEQEQPGLKVLSQCLSDFQRCQSLTIWMMFLSPDLMLKLMLNFHSK